MATADIRFARIEDVPVIVSLIEQLAEYEKLTHLLEVTPAHV
jgi:hypothetical protein